MKRTARIIATGMYAPERIVPNSYFNEMLGEDVDTWLTENLTIRERRWCSQEQSTADLAEQAARTTLQKAGVKPEELDLIIISTDTPEFISPSTASVVQHRLGATGAGTFDLNTACAGFVTALDVASKYIIADTQYNKVLVIGAYAMSKYLNMEDKKTVTLFADGAGAALLSSAEGENGFMGSLLHTEGQYNGWMGIYGGGTHKPITSEVVENKEHLLQFVKKFPKEINPTTWSRMIKELLAKQGLTPQDVTKIYFTQININSIKETLDLLSLDMDKTHVVMDRYGYTGSACIPMAMAESVELGQLKKGDVVMFMGSGGGLAFATAAFKW